MKREVPLQDKRMCTGCLRPASSACPPGSLSGGALGGKILSGGHWVGKYCQGALGGKILSRRALGGKIMSLIVSGGHWGGKTLWRPSTGWENTVKEGP